ncbi:MAG: polysaccharide biosynthesis protein [Anaerolineaceae bacterium]|nr:polysaccharide biosynthesis protein [Anaerolineaceae bacterium]
MILFGKKIRNRYMLMGDILLSAICVLASYVLRLELVVIFPTYLKSVLWMIGVAVLVKPLVYYFFGVYRRVWRYASIRELVLLLSAVSVASVAVSSIMIGLYALKAFIGFPRSVLAIDWLLSFLVIGAFRFSLRILSESSSKLNGGDRRSQKSVLIIGAGDAGAIVVRELEKNPQLNMRPIGFLDDDPEKHKKQIHGVPVLAAISELGHIIKTRPVEEVIISIPSAPGKIIRQVAETCQAYHIPFRTMPGIYELLGGKVNVNRLREVNIDDLLRREPTHINTTAIGSIMENRTVLITGAGGSIGRELCRQIAQYSPKQLLLLGHGENSIFEALLELKDAYLDIPLIPIIADVRDLPRLQVIFEKYHPQVVFHTAAHKHVPLMEVNVEEAVTNNILGTRNIVKVCESFDVERLVMISTDKAIRPVNAMGATKRFAEMLVIDAAQRTGKSFSVVRFGNVLGSRGSVVPRFKRQIAKGGPVTITHPDMKRYFMTIPEAVHLVLQASMMGIGGETFVLNMGQQVKILDLAQDLIRLSGLEPGKDIEIIPLGIRPGEKLSEDLWDEGFAFSQTNHPDVYKVESDDSLGSQNLNDAVDTLLDLATHGETDRIIRFIEEKIPGANLNLETPDLTAIT